jgi:DNA replication protein DnaC
MNDTYKTEFGHPLLTETRDRYLREVVTKINSSHPELYDEICEILETAMKNKMTDVINKRLSKACLPGYPDNYRLDDFNQSCLSGKDLKVFKELRTLEFINSNQPNLLIYGPPGFGKEKIAIGLGDLLCRRNHIVRYVDFHTFINTIKNHGVIAKSNSIYDDLEKVEILIIDDFAGINVYDQEIIDGIYILLKTRLDNHLLAFSETRKNRRMVMIPRLTIITTCHPIGKWTEHFSTDPMTVLKMINILYGSGHIISVDDNPSKLENSFTNPSSENPQ